LVDVAIPLDCLAGSVFWDAKAQDLTRALSFKSVKCFPSIIINAP